MAMPPLVAKVTIVPAMNTPKAIEGKAFLNGILNKKEITEPVQAPVTGNGTATNKTNATDPYFLIKELWFLSVLLKNQEKNLSKMTKFLESHLEIGPKKEIRKSAGTRLPKKEITKDSTTPR